jgi:hypothetical protein
LHPGVPEDHGRDDDTDQVGDENDRGQNVDQAPKDCTAEARPFLWVPWEVVKVSPIGAIWPTDCHQSHKTSCSHERVESDHDVDGLSHLFRRGKSEERQAKAAF